MMAFVPRPNQIMAIGSSAIAGNGFSIAVRVVSRSLPKREVTAPITRTDAMPIPMA